VEARSKAKSKAKRMKAQEEGGPLDPVLLKEVFDRNGSMGGDATAATCCQFQASTKFRAILQTPN